VGVVVGEVVRVSEAARVGVEDGGVIVAWLMVVFSGVAVEGGNIKSDSGNENGQSTRPCKSGHANRDKIKILMANNKTRLIGEMRIPRSVFLLLRDVGNGSSDVSGFEVIRFGLLGKKDHIKYHTIFYKDITIFALLFLLILDKYQVARLIQLDLNPRNSSMVKISRQLHSNDRNPVIGFCNHVAKRDDF
jgi:hypothetical protein